MGAKAIERHQDRLGTIKIVWAPGRLDNKREIITVNVGIFYIKTYGNRSILCITDTVRLC